MERIAILRNAIIKAKQAYYFGSTPIISDEEYDAMEDELRALCPSDPLLAQVGAPVPPDGILEKAAHSMHMGSQEKVSGAGEMRQWLLKKIGNRSICRCGYFETHIGDGHLQDAGHCPDCEGAMEVPPIHVSWKGDGGSAAAYYKNGYVTKIISRGDGSIGEDITASGIKFQGLPAYAEYRGEPFTGSVRFEAVLTKDAWQEIGGKNPRNMGNGIMGRKNGYQAELLTAYAFDVITLATYESQKSQMLAEMGFEVMPWELIGGSTFEELLNNLLKYYDDLMAQRGPNNSGHLPFWIDGIVLKIDSLDIQDMLGMSPDGKTHRGQVAWKPKTEGAAAVLKDVVLSYGHTGAIIPNGRLDPVEIGGTTVANVLLNNWDEIKRLDVAIGDTVEVVKANEIIPKVLRVLVRPQSRQAVPEPSSCPVCSGPVGRKETQSGVGAITMCFNPDCPAKHQGKIKTFIKKVDILGIGDSVREAMRLQLGINTPADLYRLGRDISPEQLANIIISGESKLGGNAIKIIEQIDAKRTLPLHIFLGSLGIEGLGRREVEIAIGKAPDALSTLRDWRSGKLRDLDLQMRINAPNKAERWANGIDANAALIDALLEHVRVIENQQKEPEVKSGGLVCITGTLPSGRKKGDYRDPLAAKGYTLVDKVTKDLAYLVLADPDSTSNKAQKARGYNAKGANIRLIGEDELTEILGDSLME